jgi:hypothetical protein
MSITNVPAATWTEVATTTADTAFQNRGGSMMYLTTVDTTGLDLSDGISVPVGFIVVVSASKTVSVNFPQGAGSVYSVAI